MMEALASGLPVAAFPVTGPNEVIGDSGAGALDEDLGKAIEAALRIDPVRCRAHAMQFSWARSARDFLALLAPFHVVPAGAAGPGDAPDLLN
jgi:glycosyltransferase involved in cell wall biosynthesis